MSSPLRKTRGQVWIETVLYTLIGLALIGVVLSYATPKINQSRDKIAVEQSIESMQILGEKIDETLQGGSGTKVIIPSLSLKKGVLTISPPDRSIYLTMNDLTSLYSENGTEISYGRVKLTSLEGQKVYSVQLKLNFSQNISYNSDTATIKNFPAASTPYKFSIEKTFVGNQVQLNFQEIS